MTKINSCGHIERKHFARGLCQKCWYIATDGKTKRSKADKAYYIKNKEKIKEAVKQRAQNNKEELKIYFKEYNRKIRTTDPLKALLAGAKSRAKRKGIEFSISKEDINVIPQFCPVLGIELLYGNSVKYKAESASLDRFDNTKGYIPGNVCIISMRANQIKSNNSIDDLLYVVDYMKGNR